MFSSLFMATVLGASASSALTAVKLPAEAPFAKLLDAALPLFAHAEEELPFGTQETKKAFIGELGQPGYLVTCVTTYMPTRAPHPVGNFLGCQIENASEPEAGVETLTFKQLTLKLGGIPVLAVPESEFCHTRAC